MNASPVTHAGSERPERKKSMLLETDALREDADAQHEDEVGRDQQVVDPVGVEPQLRIRRENHRVSSCPGLNRQHVTPPYVHSSCTARARLGRSESPARLGSAADDVRVEGDGMTWLVTGGAGYIGAHVVRAFAERGLRAVVLDDLSSGHRGFVPDDVPFVEGSILDTGLVAADAARARGRGRRARRRLQVRRGLGPAAAAHLRPERHRHGQRAAGDGATRASTRWCSPPAPRPSAPRTWTPSPRRPPTNPGVAVRRVEADRRVAAARPGHGRRAAAHVAALLQRGRLRAPTRSTTPARTTSSRS